MMSVQFLAFDAVYHLCFLSIWQLCFLLTASKEAADDLTFRSFLVLGADKAEDCSEKDIKIHGIRCVYAAASELCLHYYSQKLRHRLNRKRLEKMTLPFAVSDELLSFLRLSPDTKLVTLLLQVQYTTKEIAAMARLPLAYVEHQRKKSVDVPDLSSVRPEDYLERQILDKVYLRFSERSVSVENRIHQFGRTFERIAPWLALAVVILFVFAYFYAGALS